MGTKWGTGTSPHRGSEAEAVSLTVGLLHASRTNLRAFKCTFKMHCIPVLHVYPVPLPIKLNGFAQSWFAGAYPEI